MRSIRNAIHNPYAASRSMGVRLLLYWSAMALLLVATILSILMATGVLSHPARQLAGALDIQQRNTYAALDAQMGDLTARGVALSEKLGRELDAPSWRPRAFPLTRSTTIRAPSRSWKSACMRR